MSGADPKAVPVIGARAVDLDGVSLWLLPGGAAWWPERRVLFVSDLHLGRAPHDAPGPVAAGTAARADLARLDALLAAFGPQERLSGGDGPRPAQTIVLGDLRHAAAPERAAADEVLRTWAGTRPDPALRLVRGNQDEAAGDLPRAWGVETLEPGVALGPLRLHHFPPEADGVDGPWIAGHLHPGLAEPSGVLPAFLLEGRGLVLPAFGSGTRAHRPRRRPRQRLLPIRAGRVEGPRAARER